MNMATALCQKYHHDLIDFRVKIDLLFAFAALDDEGNPEGPALKLHGLPARGIARKISLKDRSKGMGDCEISIDGHWWHGANEEEQQALLDHELQHFEVKVNRAGVELRDDLGRPQIRIRPHDYEFGWFKCIAERHGMASAECAQAEKIKRQAGQLFWPDILDIGKVSARAA